MRREDVKDRNAEGIVFDTQIISNPSNIKEWIVFFKKDGGRGFFLVDQNEAIESFERLDDLIEILKGLGIKRAEINC